MKDKNTPETSDLIAALLEMGAEMSKDENGRITAKFIGHISTKEKVDGLHLHKDGSSLNLTAYGHKIVATKITLLSIVDFEGLKKGS